MRKIKTKHNKWPIIIGIISALIVLLIIGLIIFLHPKTENTPIEIKFDTAGGTSVNKITIQKGSPITLPKTKREGYTFEGWYYEAEKLNDGVSFDHDVTIIAKWLKESAKTLIITFDTDGGKELQKQTIECDTELDLPIPTKEGYKFINWLDKEERQITNETKLTCEDITLKAKWEKLPEEKKTEKEYTCPEGYTLKDTKCEIIEDMHERCPEGAMADGDTCVVTSNYMEDFNYMGVRNCPVIAVEIDKHGTKETIFGNYYEGVCLYYEWENFTTKEACEEADLSYDYKTTWQNGACYATAIADNYTVRCIKNYNYYNGIDLASKFNIQNSSGACLKVVTSEKYCPDTYTQNDDKCIKTIDATIKE